MFNKFKYILKRKKRFMDKTDIDIEALKKMQRMGAIIVDVRSPQEYSEGHLDGAILLSEYEVNKKYKNYLKDKEEKIVVYCSSGVRSKKAQKSLIKKGYVNVYNLYNGIENY